MKKTYSTPTITIVAIATQQVIAQSIAVGNNYSGGTIGSRDDDYLWDDEE